MTMLTTVAEMGNGVKEILSAAPASLFIQALKSNRGKKEVKSSSIVTYNDKQNEVGRTLFDQADNKVSESLTTYDETGEKTKHSISDC